LDRGLERNVFGPSRKEIGELRETVDLQPVANEECLTGKPEQVDWLFTGRDHDPLRSINFDQDRSCSIKPNDRDRLAVPMEPGLIRGRQPILGRQLKPSLQQHAFDPASVSQDRLWVPIDNQMDRAGSPPVQQSEADDYHHRQARLPGPTFDP
jgi:hypothetical protein